MFAIIPITADIPRDIMMNFFAKSYGIIPFTLKKIIIAFIIINKITRNATIKSILIFFFLLLTILSTSNTKLST